MYDQVVASVSPDTSELVANQAVVVADLQTTISEKDSEIADLAAKLAASQTNEEGLSDRVKALEKRDTLRDEEAAKDKAESIMSGALFASSIPERLQSKVTHIDYNKYMATGKLDVAGYTAAVNAEIKEWETTIGSIAPVQGISTPPAPETADADSDETVSRLLGHVQKKEA